MVPSNGRVPSVSVGSRSMFDSQKSPMSRRTVLGGVVAGGAAVVAAPLLNAGPAAASARVTPPVDVSHADAEVDRLVTSYFHDKNAARPDATMAHFSPDP